VKSRGALFGLILLVGGAAYVAALRERTATRAARPFEPSGDETPDRPAAAATPEDVRIQLRGASTQDALAILKSAARTLPRGDARGLLAEVAADRGRPVPLRLLAVELLPGVTDSDSMAETIELLRALRGEPDFPARYLVVRALGGLEDSRAAPLLAEALRTDFDVSSRLQAARALQAHLPGAAEPLRDAVLSDASEEVRMAALSSLLEGTGAASREFARQVAGLSSAPPRLRALADRWLARLPE
jgi:hypothetical protein